MRAVLRLILLLCALKTCEAQRLNYVPLEIDAKVKRIPQSYIDQDVDYIGNSLSLMLNVWPETYERVSVIFAKRERTILLLTEVDTLEFIHDGSNASVYRCPSKSDQEYWINTVITHEGTFRMMFVPIAHKELYTYRVLGYCTVRQWTYEQKNLFAIHVSSL